MWQAYHPTLMVFLGWVGSLKLPQIILQSRLIVIHRINIQSLIIVFIFLHDMTQSNSDKQGSLKQQHSDAQFLPSDYQKLTSFNSMQPSFIVDRSPLLKNYFDPHLHYSWMNRSGYPDPYNPYYECVDHFYHNPSFNMPSFMRPPHHKPHQENFAMARTSDVPNPGALMGTMHFPPYAPRQMQQLAQYTETNQFPDIWGLPGEVGQESVAHTVIKIEDDSEQERIRGERRLKSKMKNQTKNIPKNYGKAMISFILSHLDWIQLEFGIERREQLISQLKRRKNSINAIVHLKQLWTTSKYAKQFRILSNLFLRKYSFAYIFNSRVSNYSTHIKYKYKLQEALRSPGNFSRIKQY